MNLSNANFPTSFNLTPGEAQRRKSMSRPIHSSHTAHDLRNCLYLAASFASLLLDGAVGPVTPAQSDLLENILSCARKGQALLRAPTDAAGEGA